MVDFVVASTGFDIDEVRETYGQSFTPNVPGPNGSGSPGSATEVTIDSVTFGMSSEGDCDQSIVYIYDHIPLRSELDQGLYCSGYSESYNDGQEFGTSSYTRTFNFNVNFVLTPGTTYYLLLPASVWLNTKGNSPYSGGKMYSELLMPTNTRDLQFKVAMHTL